MIAALAVSSKIGLDREAKVAFALSVPAPTPGSLRPWDTWTPAFGRGFGCRPGASGRHGIGPASESLPDLSRLIVSVRMAENRREAAVWQKSRLMTGFSEQACSKGYAAKVKCKKSPLKTA